MNNNAELKSHYESNEEMWKAWEQHGVTSETILTINFHFYTTKKEKIEKLCNVLNEKGIPNNIKLTRKMIFFKGWIINADITQKWTLLELHEKTKDMFIIGKQTGISLEGCGAFMPK